MDPDTLPVSAASLNRQFLNIARDPRLIPGVHQHCDEWCDYCPVCDRCLTFRCTEAFRKAHGRVHDAPTFTDMAEAIAFTRAIAAIEGSSTAELDAIVAQGEAAIAMHTSDPLAGVALDYAVRIAAGLRPFASLSLNGPPTPGSPRPEEVLLWYHVRIYLRLVRALVAKEGKGPGGIRMDDALGSAKLVHVAVRKSRAALELLKHRDAADELTELISLLDTLERGIDERFPGARSFIRFGLDVPVV
jgi:hypothetical protein